MTRRGTRSRQGHDHPNRSRVVVALATFSPVPERGSAVLRFRRFPRLRLLAAFFMVPLVVLGNPTTAAAATVTPGPWQQVHVDFPIEPLDDRFNMIQCTFNAQHAGTHITVGSGGYCTGTPDFTPGYTQPGEAGASYSISFRGNDRAQYGGCSSSTGGTLGPHDSNGTIRVAGSIPGSLATFGSSDECDVVEVCMTTGSESTCSPLSMPYPEEEEVGESCPYGVPSVETKYREEPYASNASLKWQIWDAEVTISGPPSVFTNQWGLARQGGVQGGNGAWNVTTNRTVRIHDRLVFADQAEWAIESPWKFEVYAYGPRQPLEDEWNKQVVDGAAAIIPSPEQVAAYANNMPYFGVNDPAHCRFYFGPKIIDAPNSDIDDPQGDVGDAPTEVLPPPTIPDPTPIDPGEDFNWLQAIWAILKGIAGTLAGLASAISKAILSGISGLFVPDTSVTARVKAWDDPFEGRFPFNFGEAVQGLGGGGTNARTSALSGSSSCPAWDVKVGGESWSAVCDSSYTSAIRGARPFILAGFLAVAFMPLVRGLFYASVPLIKPVPTTEAGK